MQEATYNILIVTKQGRELLVEGVSKDERYVVQDAFMYDYALIEVKGLMIKIDNISYIKITEVQC